MEQPNYLLAFPYISLPKGPSSVQVEIFPEAVVDAVSIQCLANGLADDGRITLCAITCGSRCKVTFLKSLLSVLRRAAALRSQHRPWYDSLSSVEISDKPY